MSKTVRTDWDNFHDDTADLFPLEEYDTVEGVYDSHLFRVRYEPPEYEEEKCFYGSYLLEVFAPKENVDDNRGGTVFYTERHTEPDTFDGLFELFKRARKTASRIANNDNLHQCPYCNFLANDEWRIDKSLSMLTKNPMRRVIPTRSDSYTDTCTGLHQWFPPRAEVYRHKKDENPVYEYDELEKCDSLVLTTGYPEWRYKSQLNPYTYLKLRKYADEHPEVFEDDLDIETISRVLDFISHDQDLPREMLVSKTNMTLNE